MSSLSLPSVSGKSLRHQFLGTPPLKRIPILRKGTCVAVRASLSSKEKILKDFHARKALKIISGLQNFNKENVAAVVTAADKGGATHVDIACDRELVKLAQSLTSLPICVSAVEPEAFLTAVEAGADMVEIGNYDSFYEMGMKFSPQQILELTREVRNILPNIALSVTVPHTISLPDQVKLAELLELEGADIIQTEGGIFSNPSQSGVLGLIEKGVGSAVNKLNDVVAMIAEVKSIADALRLERSSVTEEVRTAGL